MLQNKVTVESIHNGFILTTQPIHRQNIKQHIRVSNYNNKNKTTNCITKRQSIMAIKTLQPFLILT